VAPDHELLDLSLLVFAELGYEGTSVRDLCRRLGVSHNLVHQRFGSKDALWHAAVDHGFGTLATRLAEAVNDEGLDDDLARLRAVLVRFVEVTAHSPALMRVVNQEGITPGPRLDYIYERFIRPAMAVVQVVVDRLAAAGRLRPVPLSAFYFLVADGAAGALTWPALAARFGDAPASRRPADLRRYAESVVDVLLVGMGARS
jgi:AcrR family transcriptional regulator